MKKIIYTKPDGTLVVVTPTGLIPIEQVLIKDIPKNAINPKIVDESEIPSDRTNRDCWKDNNGKIETDMDKVSIRESKISEKESERQAVLSKLKLSNEELEKIIG
jgi:hypothetical protein